jgi:hypothetical protein
MITPDKTDLAKLEADLNSLPQAFSIIHARYAQRLAGGWKEWILGVGAVDTRAYLFSVSAQAVVGPVSAREFLIGTSQDDTVFYSDIVERGRTDVDYPGRFPAGRSLEAQDNVDMLDTVVTQTLDEFLYG